MWELDCEESWVPKNWCFWTLVLEKTLESPLDCKEIQPVHSKGDQLWVFFGRTDAKAETPVLWPPHAKSWLIGKDSDAGRDLGKEEKGTTEDEMARWHHWLDGREIEWTPGVGDGQGGLGCCDSWGHKVSDTTQRLNWTECNIIPLTSSGFLDGSAGKESTCQCRRCRFDPWVGKIPGGGNGNPLQYSCLENPMEKGAWWAMVHAVAKSQKWLKWLSTHTHLSFHIIPTKQGTAERCLVMIVLILKTFFLYFLIVPILISWNYEDKLL